MFLKINSLHLTGNKPFILIKLWFCFDRMWLKMFATSSLVCSSFNDLMFLVVMLWYHYGDVIMTAMTSQITSLTIVYSIFCSDADQRKHQSSASLAFVRGIHRWPVNSPHKWPVMRKMCTSQCREMLDHDDVIKWRHFPRYWPFVRGIHRSPVNSPTKASDAELWYFRWSAPEQTVE